MKTIDDIKPPRVIYAKPLPDYNERLTALANRKMPIEAVVAVKYDRPMD